LANNEKMGHRSCRADNLRKIVKRRPERHGELMVTKGGVYMIRGDRKLKNVQLISWAQLLGSEPALVGADVEFRKTGMVGNERIQFSGEIYCIG
jgi:hypothetical protein